MKCILLAVLLCCALVGSAVAGPLSQSLEINGGENGFAEILLQRAQTSVLEDGVLKLVVSLSQAQKLTGYGFVLNYDASKYEFVEAREVEDHLLNTGSGLPTLFLASSKTPGQVVVGSLKIDGQGATGDGNLVVFTFKTVGTLLPTDFQILDGVLVDMAGNIDAVHNIEIGNLKPVPTDYALHQNHPNPFNPSTTIHYQLPEASDVRLTIYNLLGQEVRTLVRETRDAGSHSVSWDGQDELKRQVATGIYVYRLQARDFTYSRRMMLLK